MKNPVSIFCFFLVLSACDRDAPPDYTYKIIKGNSIYTDWTKDKNQAMEIANTHLATYAAGECRRALANGWSLSQIRSEGEMNCEATAEGHHCRRKNVELECRQVAEFFP